MKKFTYILALIISVSFYSCKDKTTYDKVKEFREELTSEDTTAMLKLADDCMAMLHDKKIDQALGMLSEYNDSTKEVSPLTENTRKRLQRVFTVFPVLEYERIYYSFLLEGCNDVKYKIRFAEEDNPAENGDPITYFMFNPVMKDGVWYLCVKSHDQQFDPLHK